MNISGIRPHMGFYNNKIEDGSRISDRQNREELQAEQIQSPSESIRDRQPDNRASQTASAAGQETEQQENRTSGTQDYADRYQPGVVYSLKGENSDLESLDVEQAISKMEKDQILRQYQFFVGEKKASIELQDNRNSQRAPEDFTL